MASVVNLKGRKSKSLNENEIYIGRRIFMGGWELPTSKWANPFKVGVHGTRAEVLKKYEKWLNRNPKLMDSLSELTNKTLACWCYPEPCHGDVLVRIAAAPRLSQ